jgi:hypothetical protein
MSEVGCLRSERKEYGPPDYVGRAFLLCNTLMCSLLGALGVSFVWQGVDNKSIVALSWLHPCFHDASFIGKRPF